MSEELAKQFLKPSVNISWNLDATQDVGILTKNHPDIKIEIKSSQVVALHWSTGGEGGEHQWSVVVPGHRQRRNTLLLFPSLNILSVHGLQVCYTQEEGATPVQTCPCSPPG